MHLKRQKLTTSIPIPRKGTKFVVRARSNYKNSVPILIALRDMLKLARTKKEVKYMINKKYIKINNKIVKDCNQPIHLLNILTAKNTYILTILPTGKYNLEEIKNNKYRICRVENKKIMKGKKIQINLHDSTNLIYNKKVSIGDSLQIDLNKKIKEIIPIKKGETALIISGKYKGKKCKIEEILDKKLKLNIKEDKKTTILNKKQVIIIK